MVEDQRSQVSRTGRQIPHKIFEREDRGKNQVVKWKGKIGLLLW